MWKNQEEYRAYDRKRYESNKAAGKCAYCGKHPPLAHFVACEDCRKAHRHYNLLWYRRRREMRRQGLRKEPSHVSNEP